MHAQGSASSVHAVEPKLTLPQSKSVPAPVTWVSFKSLAKPGDRLRLIGGAPHTSEGALAVPGDALSAAQQSPAGSAALGGEALLSSAQGFVLPAGSDVPLVTDADVGRWAVSLASENLSPTVDQHQAALKDRGYVEAAGGEAEGMLDEFEGLLTVRSQADRLMLLAQVGLSVCLSVCLSRYPLSCSSVSMSVCTSLDVQCTGGLATVEGAQHLAIRQCSAFYLQLLLISPLMIQ